MNKHHAAANGLTHSFTHSLTHSLTHNVAAIKPLLTVLRMEYCKLLQYGYLKLQPMWSQYIEYISTYYDNNGMTLTAVKDDYIMENYCTLT